MNEGAKIVVDDWNRGKLKYFTYPPTTPMDEQTMNA
jgi:ribosome biogenesis GTPase A